MQGQRLHLKVGDGEDELGRVANGEAHTDVDLLAHQHHLVKQKDPPRTERGGGGEGRGGEGRGGEGRGEGRGGEEEGREEGRGGGGEGGGEGGEIEFHTQVEEVPIGLTSRIVYYMFISYSNQQTTKYQSTYPQINKHIKYSTPPEPEPEQDARQNPHFGLIPPPPPPSTALNLSSPSR